MKAEEIIKALDERIKKERDYQSCIPNDESKGYEEHMGNIDYYIKGLELAIEIVKDINK